MRQKSRLVTTLLTASVFALSPFVMQVAGATGQWSVTGSLSAAHGNAKPVLLQDGRPLIVTGSTHTSATEIYNESSGQWMQAGNINQERDEATPVLLDNGKLLIAGGNDVNGTALSTAELFDPATGQWTYTGSLDGPRTLPALVKLQNGKVLAISGARDTHNSATTSCELYDPATGQWTPTGDVISPVFDGRNGDAVVLNDGRVLLVGSAAFGNSNIAELYDPNTGTWSQTGSLLVNRFETALVKLRDGRVLMVAGDQWGHTVADAELYDPTTGVWTATGSLNYERSGHDAILLPDGRVLTAGGIINSNGVIVQADLPAEIYDPTTGVWTTDATPVVDHTNGGLVLLPDGKALLAGGYSYTTSNNTDAELFTGTVFNFGGFQNPVDNLPVVNAMHAGAAVPVKFSLGGDKSLAIFNSGYPASQQYNCNSGDPVNPEEQTVAAGASGLTYDASTGTYTYVWKTNKAWTGTCRELILNFVDGSTHVAQFQFL